MSSGLSGGRRRKLIEVSVPLEAISAASEKEKNIRQGHPSTLHLWWARRPLAACRAVLFAQLVDDPSAWPERFRGEEAQAAERARLHGIIERMVKWEATTDEGILGEARWEIARSVAWGLGEEPPASDKPREVLAYLREKGPPVYDPFCGGGSIPLEAQRLGLRAYGSDLNPIPVLITKSLLEIPPRFGGRSPVNPVDRKQMGDWRGASGLAADLRHYGGWMRDEAERRIGHLYPKVRLADGSEANVFAYFWARTAVSPDPSVKGAHVSLVSSFMLSRKKGKKAWVEVVRDSDAHDGYRFEIETGRLTSEEEEKKHQGTKAGKGQGFTCALTGIPVPLAHIRELGKQKQLRERLMAVAVKSGTGKIYFAPTYEQEKAAALEKPQVPELKVEIPLGLGVRVPNYGMTQWHDLFTARQLTALQTFSDLIGEARKKILQDALASSLPEDFRPLAEGGEGAAAYADAMAIYLSFALDKMAVRNSNGCIWDKEGEKIGNAFPRPALPMVWDFTEANPLSKSTGSFANGLESGARVLEMLGDATAGECHQADAPHNNYPVRPTCIATDPPYYDNIGYADLSDFFYVWLRRSLREVWPSLFRRVVTPKEKELIAAPHRHDKDRKVAEKFFMDGMGDALKAMREAVVEDMPVTIFYAFKQTEVAQEGITSAGWASFLQAIINAGFVIDGTWPMRTEMGGRMRATGSNALASSVVLVCVKRPENAREGTRQEFRSRLKAEMPAALQKIKEAGVGPVDMTQSALGPGMGIFSTYTKVLELDDSEMSVRDAIALINQIREEILGEEDALYDAYTRFCIDWFQIFGMEEGPAGDAINKAQGYNLSIDDGMLAGVFSAKKGKARLISRWDMPREWQPDAQRPPPHWECLQHLIVALEALDGGTTAAAELLAQMDSEAGEAARRLAHRLYDICEKKGWAQEARSYNILGSEFFHMETRAGEILRRPPLKQTGLELPDAAER